MTGNDERERPCSFCGLPPKRAEAGTLIPLKRCSRCHQAWYHDIDCQRKHFSVHKKECKKLAQEIKKIGISAMNGDDVQPWVQVDSHPTRGQILVAAKEVPKLSRITDTTSNIKDEHEAYWQPIVPPVLLEELRFQRCAYCFATLPENSLRFDSIPKCPYSMLFCSALCRRRAKETLLYSEESCISRLYRHQPPPKLLPTAVLVYRVLVALRHHPEKQSDVENLQWSSTRDSTSLELDQDSYHHSQTVIALVTAMVRLSDPQLSMALPGAIEIQKMINRIKINGFSISDGESIGIGIGLYATASSMNHSCRPNVVATFLYGKQHLPSLVLTSCDHIPKGSELCISYIDNAAPRSIRSTNLRKNYFFQCQCERCQDDEDEQRTSGIKAGSDQDQVQKMTTSIAGGPKGLSVEALDWIWNLAKKNCTIDSWYVQESGDNLVAAILVELGKATSTQEQESVAARALQILKTLQSRTTCSNDRTLTLATKELQVGIRHLKIGRLLLFLEPDPREAMMELRAAKKIMSRYYPRNHEICEAIETSIREASM